MKKIALIGEAWGKEEAALGLPFVGKAGQELTRMLALAGIDRKECFITNVLNLRPGVWWAKQNSTLPPENSNDLKYITLTHAEARALDPSYSLSPLASGGYLHPQLYPELDRLRGELEQFQRDGGNIAVALGGTAMWALSGSFGVAKSRGVVQRASICPGLKMLTTYHPAAVLREWSLRAIAIADLAKAGREAATSDIKRPARKVYIADSLHDLESFDSEMLVNARDVSVDIETGWGQITCIGFAPSPFACLVVPIFYENVSWWSETDEVEVWKFIRRVLRRPSRKIGQNFLYDLQWLLRQRINVNMLESDDTMLMHHALYPELEKSLGFLGATYCNDSAWKQLKRRGLKGKKDE